MLALISTFTKAKATTIAKCLEDIVVVVSSASNSSFNVLKISTRSRIAIKKLEWVRANIIIIITTIVVAHVSKSHLFIVMTTREPAS